MAMQSKGRLAMLSVPWQEYTTPYAPAEALLYGTIFPSLNQPYPIKSSVSPSNIPTQKKRLQ